MPWGAITLDSVLFRLEPLARERLIGNRPQRRRRGLAPFVTALIAVKGLDLGTLRDDAPAVGRGADGTDRGKDQHRYVTTEPPAPDAMQVLTTCTSLSGDTGFRSTQAASSASWLPGWPVTTITGT